MFICVRFWLFMLIKAFEMCVYLIIIIGIDHVELHIRSLTPQLIDCLVIDNV